MSLRVRLAILCASLAVCTAAAFGFVSYHSTSDRMTAQVDASLRSAAFYLTGAAANYDPEQTETNEGKPPWIDPGPGGPGGILDQVAVQHLDVTGLILTLHAGPVLPIDAIDRAVASGALHSAIQTITVSGVDFRVITVGLRGGGAVQVAQSLNQRTLVLRGLKLQFSVLGFLVALIGALVGWLIALRLTRPLERLTRATEDIARTGSTSLPLERIGTDEVGRLSKSFARMLDALESSRQQQHQLIRDAGHELRTPITSLRTNIELLERHDAALSPDQRAELLGNLETELEELTSLVNEIVDVATDSASEEHQEEVDLFDLAERVAAQVSRRHGASVTVTGCHWTLLGLPKALERAVSNLCENAVKFAGAAAPITIAVAEGSITVTDSGPGVAKSELNRIFDRFYRPEASKSLPGSGLGLSIVAGVAEAHGGAATARNLPAGGFAIEMTFPTS